MNQYKVTRWANEEYPATIDITVEATSHREALEKSGLKSPGSVISVNGLADLNIRYQVDSVGRVNKLAHYGALD